MGPRSSKAKVAEMGLRSRPVSASLGWWLGLTAWSTHRLPGAGGMEMCISPASELEVRENDLEI